jgi:hypothetical protein
MRTTTLLLLSGFLLVACSRETPPETKQGATVTYVFRLDRNPDWSQTPLKFQADGKDVSTPIDNGGFADAAFFSIKVARALPPNVLPAQAREQALRAVTQPGTPGIPRITVTALFPCGWKPLTVVLAKSNMPDEEPDQISLQAEIWSHRDSMYLQGRPGMTTVVVDNRGGPARRLALGEWKGQVKADTAEVFHIGLPDCEAGKAVSLDGEILGTLSDPKKTVLVDPEGKRCYHFRGLNYFKAGEAGWSPWTYGLSRRKLHVIAEANGKIDHLFEKAPSSVHSTLGFEQRSELTERSCGGE